MRDSCPPPSEKKDPAAESGGRGGVFRPIRGHSAGVLTAAVNKLSTKGQVVNILGFGADSQLSHCSAKGM